MRLLIIWCLTELTFENNQIKYIEENALQGLTQLQILRLQLNQITFIHENTFADLKN